MLAPGQDAAVASGLNVRFVAVLGDSRCPADAMCVHAGDAIVRVDITAGGNTGGGDLHTGTMQPVVVDNVRVELVKLDPYPFSSTPIEPGDYRATLRVVR